MKKLLGTAFLGIALVAGAAHAQVYVRIGPPAPRVERRPPPPTPRHVWVDGFYRWDGRAYVWAPGYWTVPPRARARWIPGHWTHRRRGYYWVEGHWR
jgi:hypothetical protein